MIGKGAKGFLILFLPQKIPNNLDRRGRIETEVRFNTNQEPRDCQGRLNGEVAEDVP